MKKKILSLLLASLMIFASFLPLNIDLFCIDADAAGITHNANIAPVEVGSLGELEFALENSVEGQTITLTADIIKENAYDWQMDISAEGILVLDLNGFDIDLDSANTAVLFNITKATEFHIIDSQANPYGNLGSIKFSSKVKDNEVSVIAVNNSNAALFLHNSITLFLNTYEGDAVAPSKASVISLKKFFDFNNYGTNLNTNVQGALGVAFYPERYNSYNNSHFNWYKGNIVTDYGHCFNFDQKVQIGSERMPTSFIHFANITMMPGSNYYAMNVYHNDSSAISKFFIPSKTYTVKAAGTVINSSTALNTPTYTKGVNVQLSVTCSHSNSNSIVSYKSGHASACSSCGGNHKIEGHSLSTLSVYVNPTTYSTGKTSGLKCGTEGCSYDTSVVIPKIEKALIKGTVYEVNTYEKLQEAFRDAEAGSIIRLTADCKYTKTNDATVATLRPQARGAIVLDLNGFNIAVSSKYTKTLIDLSMFDPAKGATSLYIVNSKSATSPSKISFENVNNNNYSLVNLSNAAASLYITDGVKLTMSTTASVTDTSIIYARCFKDLKISNGTLQNAIQNGKGIIFRPGNNIEGQKATVNLDKATIMASETCLDSNFALASYKEFKIGTALLSCDNAKRAITVLNTDTSTISNIVRTTHSAKNISGTKQVKNVNNNIIEVKLNSNCSHPLSFVFVADDTMHKMYCSNCFEATFSGKHGTIEATDRCDNPAYAAGINCDVCGYQHRTQLPYVGHEADSWNDPVPASCKGSGIKYSYATCKHCGEDIYTKNGFVYLFDGSEIDPQTSHNKTYVGYKSPSCDEKGWKTHYKCDDCQQYFLQGSDTPVDWSDIEYDYDHDIKAVEGTATCTTPGTLDHFECEDCGRKFWDEEGSSRIQFTSAYTSQTPHHKLTSVHINGKTATCTEYGIAVGVPYGECADCGKTIIIIDFGNSNVLYKSYTLEEMLDSEYVIPKTAHNVGSVIKGEKPTCTNDGISDHYKCNVCGKLFADKDAKNELTDVSDKSPGHKYEWVVTTPAEVGKPGEKANKCSVCGDIKETAPVPALEPEYTLGDVDEDGKLSASDARLALRASVGLETLSDAQKKAADADKDTKILAADARLILRASVGLETLK